MSEVRLSDIGSITDMSGEQLLHMWNVDVTKGTRPLWNHCHMNFEITMVDSGKGIYTIGETEHEMSCGDIFVFSGNEHHCITSVKSEKLRITNLHFEPRYLMKNFVDEESAINANFCFLHSKSFKNRIEAEQTGDIPYYFRCIADELSSHDTGYAVAVKSMLNLILVTLIRKHGYLDDKHGISTNREQIESISRVITYIDEHFDKKLTLEAISAEAGLSPNYLSSLFRKISGITLWNYVNSKRIEKAVKLITDENIKENMIDIAAECGFNNTANFNKTFKTVTGMTPKEYRNNAHLILG